MTLPIFIGYTRSFWFGILPILLTALDFAVVLFSDATMAPPIALVISHFTGWDIAEVETTFRTMSPVFALVIAHQRSGASRPYTIDPRAK